MSTYAQGTNVSQLLVSSTSRSKRLVGGLAAFSDLAPHLWPSFLPLVWLIAQVSMYFQWAICFYVILHQTVYDCESGRALHQTDSSGKSSVVDH